MSDKFTIQGNIRIADFMGYDLHKGLLIHRQAKTPIGNTIKPEELKYHESWDVLMPVVKKCFESLVGITLDKSFGLELRIKNGLNEVDLTKTYNATLEYIDWYKYAIKI